MTTVTKHNKSIVYDDDTTILVSGRSLTETKQHSNDILNRFYQYFTINTLSANPSKTKNMLYKPVHISHRNKKHLYDTTNTKLTCTNTKLTCNG